LRSSRSVWQSRWQALLAWAYLGYALVEMNGLGNPWTLAAFGVAGGVALVLLFVRPYGEMLIINSVLASAGLIFTSLLAWFPYFRLWNGMSALIIAAVAVAVGLIHQFRELPGRPALQRRVAEAHSAL
jgi:hypothetical protein